MGKKSKITKGIFSIVLAIAMIAFVVLNFMGLGYLTDSTFNDRKPDEYETWKINLMKMFIVVSWIAVALNLIQIGYNVNKGNYK